MLHNDLIRGVLTACVDRLFFTIYIMLMVLVYGVSLNCDR